MRLDKLNYKLLEALEHDARQTTTQLAKQLKTSQQVVSYRMSRLEEEGIIGGYHTIINFTKLSYTSYRTMVRLSNINEQIHKKIITYLNEHPNVLWLVECGGRWDLLFDFFARNIIHFNQLLQNFREAFPEHIQNYSVLTTVELQFFGRDYFTNRKREHRDVPYYGRKEEMYSIDEEEIRILKSITGDARATITKIAKEAGVATKTAIRTIKDLEKKGMIQGYRPLIHIDKTPFSEYKALIRFHNSTEHKEKELITFLQKESNVVFTLKLVGAWDFEIEFATKNKEETLTLTRSIRDRFTDIIKEFEVIPLYHEYKYNYFPGDLIPETS